ncbi:unnamed protein product, partial [Prorocentrum cordatum]
MPAGHDSARCVTELLLQSDVAEQFRAGSRPARDFEFAGQHVSRSAATPAATPECDGQAAPVALGQDGVDADSAHGLSLALNLSSKGAPEWLGEESSSVSDGPSSQGTRDPSASNRSASADTGDARQRARWEGRLDRSLERPAPAGGAAGRALSAMPEEADGDFSGHVQQVMSAAWREVEGAEDLPQELQMHGVALRVARHMPEKNTCNVGQFSGLADSKADSVASICVPAGFDGADGPLFQPDTAAWQKTAALVEGEFDVIWKGKRGDMEVRERKRQLSEFSEDVRLDRCARSGNAEDHVQLGETAGKEASEAGDQTSGTEMSPVYLAAPHRDADRASCDRLRPPDPVGGRAAPLSSMAPGPPDGRAPRAPAQRQRDAAAHGGAPTGPRGGQLRAGGKPDALHAPSEEWITYQGRASHLQIGASVPLQLEMWLEDGVTKGLWCMLGLCGDVCEEGLVGDVRAFALRSDQGIHMSFCGSEGADGLWSGGLVYNQ